MSDYEYVPTIPPYPPEHYASDDYKPVVVPAPPVDIITRLTRLEEQIAELQRINAQNTADS